ncbi:hypothetical protein B0A69_12150 [Chryseobacterium shigense]|nr:hypothetical protein B0A69_12150 [Chryseobacterium shigense]
MLLLYQNKLNMEKIKVITRLTNREMSAHDFINYCKNIVVNLKNIFSDLKMVSIWDDSTNSKFYFENNLANFSVQNLDKILIYNPEEDVFQNDNEQDKNLYENSKSWIGFNTLLYLSKDKSEASDLSINITQGASEKNKTALINIEFSDEFLTTLTKDFSIKLIESLEKSGDLVYAVVISNELRRKVKTSGQNLWIGYLTYFQHKNIKINLPDSVNSINYDKGILIDLGEKIEISDEAVNKAVTIRNILGDEALNYSS